MCPSLHSPFLCFCTISTWPNGLKESPTRSLWGPFYFSFLLLFLFSYFPFFFLSLFLFCFFFCFFFSSFLFFPFFLGGGDRIRVWQPPLFTYILLKKISKDKDTNSVWMILRKITTWEWTSIKLSLQYILLFGCRHRAWPNQYKTEFAILSSLNSFNLLHF